MKTIKGMLGPIKDAILEGYKIELDTDDRETIGLLMKSIGYEVLKPWSSDGFLHIVGMDDMRSFIRTNIYGEVVVEIYPKEHHYIQIESSGHNPKMEIVYGIKFYYDRLGIKSGGAIWDDVSYYNENIEVAKSSADRFLTDRIEKILLLE